MLIALLRSGPSRNVVVMIDRAAGAMNAAAMPLTTRVRMSSQPLVTRPPTRLTAAKTTVAQKNIRRRPKRSAARPPRSRKPPYATAYPEMIHWSCSALRPMSRCISGRATPISETSMESRKSCAHSTSRTRFLRAPSPVGAVKAFDWRSDIYPCHFVLQTSICTPTIGP